jgi:hypothetical protein
MLTCHHFINHKSLGILTHLSERPKNHARVQGRVSFKAALSDEGHIGMIKIC